jgi:hypothetical protein
MATILDLLMALNQGDLPPIPAPASPVPLAPAPMGNVPEFGGPSMATEAPQAPLDTRIIQQMLALRGPAPTAPAPLSRGQRIANALIGFGAGVEGRGGQFLQQLQKPQREYKRQVEKYNQEGTELGVRALETAQRQQERQTTRAQQVSDRQFAAEVDREARRLHLTDQRELEMFRDTLLARRQREDDERQAAEQRRREKAQQERDARVFASQLGKGQGAAPARIAEELGNYYAKLTDILSPAAEGYLNAQAKRAQILASRPAGGGGGASAKAQKALQGFEAIKQKLIEAVKVGNSQAQKQLMTDLNRSFRGLARFPEIEAGFDASGKWPYAKFRGGQSSTAQTAAPQDQQNDPLGIR